MIKVMKVPLHQEMMQPIKKQCRLSNKADREDPA